MVCGVLDGNLSPGQNRYRPYWRQVGRAERPGYVVEVDSPMDRRLRRAARRPGRRRAGAARSAAIACTTPTRRCGRGGRGGSYAGRAGASPPFRPSRRPMLILLPPSEGKADAGTGRRLDPGPAVAARAEPGPRAGAGRPGGAQRRAGRGGRAGGARSAARASGASCAATPDCGQAATAPAERLYTGVLYEALDLASLPAAAQRAARRSILISSGLWGAVRLADRIPPYRCPIGARLPGVGALSTYWRRELTPALDGGRRAAARCWTCAPARTPPPGRRAVSWPSGR